MIGKPCSDMVCRLGDATLWLILHTVNYTNGPHQNQQLHFFQDTIEAKTHCKCSDAELVSPTLGPASGMLEGTLVMMCQKTSTLVVMVLLKKATSSGDKCRKLFFPHI